MTKIDKFKIGLKSIRKQIKRQQNNMKPTWLDYICNRGIKCNQNNDKNKMLLVYASWQKLTDTQKVSEMARPIILW